MEHKVTLDEIKNEVFRKIGRNMMLFQKLEYLLKFIVAKGKLSGCTRDLKELQTQREDRINKQTMGQLVGQYIEYSNPNCEAYISEPEEKKGLFLSFGFQIECDSKYYEAKKETLTRIVSERNELVHHLLTCFDINSVESCDETGKKLDFQSENLHRAIKELEAIADALIEGRKEFLRWFASNQGKKQLQFFLSRQSRLVFLLCDIAAQTVRPDGWALMSVAGQLIKKHNQEEFFLLKEKYGYKSLKAFIFATDIFDVFEEPTDKGGFRVLYRLKPGWELSKDNEEPSKLTLKTSS